jgi:hypothetical protein
MLHDWDGVLGVVLILLMAAVKVEMGLSLLPLFQSAETYEGRLLGETGNVHVFHVHWGVCLWGGYE